jgi:hypothetical protein
MRIHKSGHEICSLEDWYLWGPPKKGALQWKDGRSAKELARSWFRKELPAPPEELRSLVEKTFGTGIVFEEAKPECVIQLDEFEGEHRNCDLIILCRNESQRIVISVEAKADETFGDSTIGDYYDRKLNTRSNVPKRIEQLLTAIFGREPDGAIRKLRYQLLHSVAGALIEASAEQANCAVFLVHEFHSANLNPEKMKQNLADWSTFVRAFPTLGTAAVERNQILGPFSVPGHGRVTGSIPLYLGNCVTELSAEA